jgi:hypothetical protein
LDGLINYKNSAFAKIDKYRDYKYSFKGTEGIVDLIYELYYPEEVKMLKQRG